MTQSHKAILPAYLGAGGEAPGVWGLLAADTGVTERVLALDCGHSVYAIGVSLDDGLLVCGTRQGELVVIQLDAAPTLPVTEFRSWDVGAGVLALALVDARCVVTADEAGRCLSWDLSADDTLPVVLAFERGVVCGLAKLPDGRLAGITNEGMVVVWDLPGGRVRTTAHGPRPARPIALARLAYWAPRQALIYATEDGQLAGFDVAKGRFQVDRAHDGGFLFVDVVGAELLTVGRYDGCCRRWTSDSAMAVEQCGAPTGVLGGCALGEAGERLLLLTEAGRAVIYCSSAAEDEPVALDRVACRVVARPDAAALRQWMAREDARAAGELAGRLQARLSAGGVGPNEHDYQQLHALGYPHVALHLKAEAARREDDRLGELAACHALARCLPDATASVPSLVWYAALLQRFALLTELAAIIARIRRIDPVRANKVLPSDFPCEALHALTTIEPAEPIEVLVAAATALARPCQGRFALGSNGALDPRCPVSAAAFIEKYAQVCEEQGLPTYPPLATESAWWAQGDRARKVELVVVRCRTFRWGDLELALRFEDHAAGTTIVPVWVLRAQSACGDERHEEHNQSVLHFVNAEWHESVSAAWRNAVESAVQTTLQRLITETRNAQRVQRNASHG
jgi:hypothetical protein